MPRLQALTNGEAEDRARPILEAVEKKLGTVPNMIRTMANAPAVLEAYMGFSSALAKGALSARFREQIALAVGEANGCEYCLAAHSALGLQAGLSIDEIAESRHGGSANPKTASALTFARGVVREHGQVNDDDLDALRAAGLDDGEITEVVANVALNLFTNYFNHVAETDVDFPRVEMRQPAATCNC